MEAESEELLHKFSDRQLIGTGSNGNRVYKVLNQFDLKVLYL
jgi:hypothetical protein